MSRSAATIFLVMRISPDSPRGNGKRLGVIFAGMHPYKVLDFSPMVPLRRIRKTREFWDTGANRQHGYSLQEAAGNATNTEEASVSFDPIESLRSAGVPVEVLNEEQRSVLTSLSESEVSTLASIQSRLTMAGGDVEGQHNFVIVL
jgi:hypothetical protein